MAYEIEIITDDRFLDRYDTDDIKLECENMLGEIHNNLVSLGLYVEVYKKPYLVDFDDNKQYRTLLFIQFKNRKISLNKMMETVNKVYAPYYKKVKNKKLA